MTSADRSPNTEINPLPLRPAAPIVPSLRALRVAFVTDIHIQPERRAAEGAAACLQHIHSLPDRPDLILNGGDCVMDAVSVGAERARVQWDLWDDLWRAFPGIPVMHCLGNHDIWGYNKKRSGCTGLEPLYGKRYALNRFGLTERYYSIDRAGWHFVVLDSSFGGVDGVRFEARLDPEQRAWLEADLEATPRRIPIVIVSHIPILAGGSIFFAGARGEFEKDGGWALPASWMHADAQDLTDLLYAYPNVRLCLSGHTHLHDRLDYNGIAYLTGGAVCGRWWRGSVCQTPPGYLLLDLYTDGSFASVYVPTGWSVTEEPQYF